MAISAKQETVKRGITVPAGLQVRDVSDREASKALTGRAHE